MRHTFSTHIYLKKVDENLFYKGVDKHKVEPARLVQQPGQQKYEPSDSDSPSNHNASSDPTLPTYAFHSGDSLLALTRKHNVSYPLSSPKEVYAFVAIRLSGWREMPTSHFSFTL